MKVETKHREQQKILSIKSLVAKKKLLAIF